MNTTIRLRREKLNEDFMNRNSASVLSETKKTITYQIFTGAAQAGLTEKQIKKNWNCFIF